MMMIITNKTKKNPINEKKNFFTLIRITTVFDSLMDIIK